MAQRPTNDFDIDPNITSGTDLANILNRFQDAIDSGNSGGSRPAYLAAGGMWVKEGAPMRLYFYDGTKDIELYNTADGLVGASQWEENGNDIYYDKGNVGIGVTAPSQRQLYVQEPGTGYGGGITSATTTAGGNAGYRYDTAGVTRWLTNLMGAAGSESLRFLKDGTDEKMRIDATGDATFSGNVGIGGAPGNPKAGEYLEQAKTQIAGWRTTFDDRLKAEPKSDKKAVTLEITDGDFSVFPTAEALAEKLAGRAIGGGTAKLQVAGDGYFSGGVDAIGAVNAAMFSGGGSGIFINASGQVMPVDEDGNFLDGLATHDIGSDVQTFQNGYFSGTVNAKAFVDENGPIVSAFAMVDAFRKIKNAVADETTVEGIKESLTNVLGGLIEEFESIGTQES